MTFIGWVFLLIPVAIVAYGAIRLIPVYLNYMRVAKSVDDVVAALGGQSGVSTQMIRGSLEKRFDIESITFPDVKDVEIRRDGESWVIEAKYTDGAPLIANVSLEIDFDKVGQFGG